MRTIERPIRETQIAEIAKLEDPVLRNLLITLAYHDLAKGMSAVVGETDNTWCGFATWASRTAGIEIRGEELPRVLRRLISESERVGKARARVAAKPRVLGGLLESHLMRHLLNLAGHITDHVSREIAIGNQIVFAELAPRYADLIAGRPQPAPVSEPTPVDAAFASYERAVVTPEPDRRAQLILLANLLAVRHEQERLQPYIQRALDAPVADVLASFRRAPVLGLVFRALRWAFPEDVAELVREIEKLFEVAATELMMTMKVPGQDLHLGRDVPPPLEGPFIPPELAEIDLPELATLMKELDRSRGDGRGTGAENWVVLEERMNYITTLFRSRQQQAALRDSAPFTETQQREMERGRIPSGSL